MGVFVPAVNPESVNLGFMVLKGSRQLFLPGALAIAAGIFTYSERVMKIYLNSAPMLHLL